MLIEGFVLLSLFEDNVLELDDFGFVPGLGLLVLEYLLAVCGGCDLLVYCHAHGCV